MFNRKEYMKEWRDKNKERIEEYRKTYYQEHKDYENKCSEEYRQNNKEKIAEGMSRYNKTERGKACCQRAQTTKRTKGKDIINTLTAEEWLDILKQHNFKCAYCGKDLLDLFDKPTRDHVIPLNKGGDNTAENVVPACKSCNGIKGDRLIEVIR